MMGGYKWIQARTWLFIYIKCNAMYIKLTKKVLGYIIIVTDIHHYNKTAP